MQENKYTDTTKQVGVFIAILIILGIRSGKSIIYPPLRWEDGTHMLAFYFNSTNPADIFRFYAGYISLIPNAIGYLATRFPVIYAPYVMAWSSLVIAAYGFYLISSSRFEWVISSLRLRIVIAILLSLLPLGGLNYVLNLTYSQWNILFIVTLLLASPLPNGFRARLWEVLLVSLCIFSHPLTIGLLPLCIIRFFVTKDKVGRIIALVYAFLIILYPLITMVYVTLVSPGRLSHFNLSFSTVWLSTKVFLCRSLVGAFTGTGVVSSVVASEDGVAYVCLAGIVIILLTILASTFQHNRVRHLSWCILGFGLALGFIFVSCATRNGDQSWIFRGNWREYTSRLVCALCILTQLVPVLWQALSKQVFLRKTLLLTAIVIYLIAINIHGQFFYRSPLGEGRRLRAFVQEVHQDMIRAKQGDNYKEEHVFNRGGHWDIVLNIDKRLHHNTTEETADPNE
ncbi:hypothetical protein ACFL6U_11370 [Planctomycetota bacterium]